MRNVMCFWTCETLMASQKNRFRLIEMITGQVENWLNIKTIIMSELLGDFSSRYFRKCISYLLNLVALSLQICFSNSKQKPLPRVDPISCLCFLGQHFSKYVSNVKTFILGWNTDLFPPMQSPENKQSWRGTECEGLSVCFWLLYNSHCSNI